MFRVLFILFLLFYFGYDSVHAQEGVSCTPPISGSVTVSFPTNSAHSNIAHVDIPTSCISPSVVTQSMTNSANCQLYNGACNNNLGTASTDLQSFAVNLSSGGFDVFLSADDVIAPGGNYEIEYQVVCNNDLISEKKIFGGVTNVVYYNGNSHSVITRVNFPSDFLCTYPSVVTQSNIGSVNCQLFDGSCNNNRGTASTDIRSYATGVSETGFDVFLSADDVVNVGASSPAFPISYQVTCNTGPDICSNIDGVQIDMPAGHSFVPGKEYRSPGRSVFNNDGVAEDEQTGFFAKIIKFFSGIADFFNSFFIDTDDEIEISDDNSTEDILEGNGICLPDSCENIWGIQEDVPDNYFQFDDGTCYEDGVRCNSPILITEPSHTWTSEGVGGNSRYSFLWSRDGVVVSNTDNYTEVFAGYGVEQINLTAEDVDGNVYDRVCAVSYQSCFVNSECSTGEICYNNVCAIPVISEINSFYRKLFGNNDNRDIGGDSCKLYWDIDNPSSCVLKNKLGQVVLDNLVEQNINGHPVGPGVYHIECGSGATNGSYLVTSDQLTCISNIDLRET